MPIEVIEDLMNVGVSNLEDGVDGFVVSLSLANIGVTRL